jgi:hypothetical protein
MGDCRRRAVVAVRFREFDITIRASIVAVIHPSSRLHQYVIERA